MRRCKILESWASVDTRQRHDHFLSRHNPPPTLRVRIRLAFNSLEIGLLLCPPSPSLHKMATSLWDLQLSNLCEITWGHQHGREGIGSEQEVIDLAAPPGSKERKRGEEHASLIEWHAIGVPPPSRRLGGPGPFLYQSSILGGDDFTLYLELVQFLKM